MLSRILRTFLLVPAIAAGLLGTSLVNAAPATASTKRWSAIKQEDWYKDGTRKLQLRAALQTKYDDNGEIYMRAYIRVRTYKKIDGKWKRYPHSVAPGSITLECSNGVQLGQRVWELGNSGKDGTSSKYGRYVNISTLHDKRCTAVRAYFTGTVGTSGRRLQNGFHSNWG